MSILLDEQIVPYELTTCDEPLSEVNEEVDLDLIVPYTLPCLSIHNILLPMQLRALFRTQYDALCNLISHVEPINAHDQHNQISGTIHVTLQTEPIQHDDTLIVTFQRELTKITEFLDYHRDHKSMKLNIQMDIETESITLKWTLIRNTLKRVRDDDVPTMNKRCTIM
jgi:hypothetical protein